MKVLFVQTGGTIDKDYPHTTKGWAFEFGEPASIRILEKLNPSFEFEIQTAFQKDSLEINDTDRKNLTDLIVKSNLEHIIITHGTDTMVETATFLAEHIKNKVIVITGAMRPEQFSNSDAPVNIGTAIGAVQILGPGVYIAMHGIVKPWNSMKRNLDTGKYY
ncbi:MAG: asparaginase [Cyclobacteriaceae bacterium]|nr:asparaginase [Cyclobacteriaceae bacterium]